MTVYGIPNCDTVQKAIKWLKSNNINFDFYDFKKHGITEGMLLNWVSVVGMEKLFNKQSTTWKQLDQKVKDSVKTPIDLLKLLRENPSMIKRPVIDNVITILVGFDEKTYREHFLK